MAYDVARGRVVLFGGIALNQGVFTETWEWDGVAWQPRAPALLPPTREKHALAYDVIRQRVLLFGGNAGGQYLSDTWAWDGANWTLLTPGTSPPGMALHTMAQGPGGQIVLFGGNTWTWDGTNWTQRAARGPGSRSAHTMAYDAARARTVLHGGWDGTSTFSDTWEWDGATWRQAPVLPMQRGNAAMAYDGARRVMVLFGGYGSLTWLVDTWTFDGTQWRQIRDDQAPCLRNRHAMIYDETLQRVVLFGGEEVGHSGSRVFDDTWVWEHTRWTPRNSQVRPAHRAGHAMAYDTARRRGVLFGGGTLLVLGDTWEWDGNVWTQLAPNPAPPARVDHGMAYDAARGRVVLFGGSNPMSSSYYSDTWEWDGLAWFQRAPTTQPSARSRLRMEYDSARQRVVLFGGFNNGVTTTDTWEWDGVTWAQRSAIGPNIVAGGTAYHQDRQRVVLHGGGNWAQLPQTWEWDGSTWTQSAMALPPTSRQTTVMTYDPSSRRVVMFGGSGSHPLVPIPISHGDTWFYGNVTTPAAMPVGVACAGTNGLPQLLGDGPYLGAPGFALELASARASASCAFALATGTQSLAIGGGCMLYLQGGMTVSATITNAAGHGNVSFAVPVNPTLRGVTLYAQAFVQDPLGAAGGIAVSAGRRLVFGD